MPGYCVSASLRDQLLTDGYVRLPGALPPALLSALRNSAERLESAALAEHDGGRIPGHAAFSDGDQGTVVERLDKLLEADPNMMLELLACPAMMAVARELSGPGTVPIEMDLLLKNSHPNGYVIWHQGAQHSRRWPYLNVGAYLDDAPIDDGCLRYVPRTQDVKQDICTLTERHGWDLPGAIDVPAKAGDILVQDMMVLHSSLPKRVPGRRRTVYIELRPAQAIVADRSQSPEWAELRRRWMALVVERAAPEDWPSDWRAELPRVGTLEDEVAAIAAMWEAPLPSHYCDHPVEHPDYPVPADLR